MQLGEVDREDDQGNIIPGQWRQGRQLTATQRLAGNRATVAAKVQTISTPHLQLCHGRIMWWMLYRQVMLRILCIYVVLCEKD